MLRFLGLVVAISLLTGCLSLRYITQAAAGQEKLNGRGIAIDEIVEGHHLDRRTRELLSRVDEIKRFGEAHGLKHTNNYRRYVWLDRSAVVWVVSACDPLRFRPKVWKFPIVGSITYTGWFAADDAKKYARELASSGWDIDVRPSEAYSTLGWFDDPILSTMIAEGKEALGDLADVVLHETLHATFFVAGQSTLNESVASFFGDHLAEQYLVATVGRDAEETTAFLAYRERSERRGRVMKDAYVALDTLYESDRSREEKLAEKKAIVDDLRSTLGIRRPLTNATLIQYKTYGSGKEELAELFHACSSDFKRMLGALQRLRPIAAASPPHTDPAVLLKAVVAAGCD